MPQVPLPSYFTPDKNQKARGVTPLHIATGLFRVSNTPEGAIEDMDVALAATGDVNAKDKAGNTALHEAGLIMMTGAAKYLLAHGADVNALNNNHETPLFRCVSQVPNKETVDVLLAAGADPYIKGRRDKNVLEYIKKIPTQKRLDAFRQFFSPEEIVEIEEGIKRQERLAEIGWQQLKDAKIKF